MTEKDEEGKSEQRSYCVNVVPLDKTLAFTEECLEVCEQMVSIDHAPRTAPNATFIRAFGTLGEAMEYCEKEWGAAIDEIVVTDGTVSGRPESHEFSETSKETRWCFGIAAVSELPSLEESEPPYK